VTGEATGDMTSTPDPLSLVEAAYRIGEPTAAWLDRVLGAFAHALGCEARGAATLFDARPACVAVSDTTNSRKRGRRARWPR
jgi:hypothetical protein